MKNTNTVNNKKTHPLNILYFNAFVFAILSIIMFAFPKDGIKISDNVTLEFISYDDLWEDKVSYKDISNILADTAQISYSKKPNIFTSYISDNFNDTLGYLPTQAGGVADSVTVDMGELIAENQKIQFPDGNKLILYPLFEQLKNNDELIRIVHYGDSQIEGDRITSFIRNELQKQFGGGGVGLLQTKQAHYYGITMKHFLSPNWRRYNLKQHKKLIKDQKFGALLSFARFAPLRNIDESLFENDTIKTSDSLDLDNIIDSIPEKNIVKKVAINTGKHIYSGEITFKTAPKTYQTNKEFSKCSIYYCYNMDTVDLEVYANEELIHSTRLLPTNKLSIASFPVNSPQELRLKFKGKDSPNIYGIAMDKDKGIAVDNVPMRGSAGTVFTSMNIGFLKEMYDLMNVKLLIMQFGGNVTPYIRNDYDYYAKMFSSQLQAMKRIMPYTSIIVIGPADMSQNVNGSLISYPNIPGIRDALRDAAFSNGAAFWDMYSAMGGKNSMPSWVRNKPALAAKDYTHFTHLGAEIIARMFYNSLIVEYNQYLHYNN